MPVLIQILNFTLMASAKPKNLIDFTAKTNREMLKSALKNTSKLADIIHPVPSHNILIDVLLVQTLK